MHRGPKHNNFLLKALIRESDFLEDYKLAGALVTYDEVTQRQTGQMWQLCRNSQGGSCERPSIS